MKKILLFLFVLAIFTPSTQAQKITVEEVLTKHLQSIGSIETLGSTKSLITVGEVSVNFISQKNLTAQGRAVFASSGEKCFWGLNFNAADYPFEKFSFDGKSSKIAFVRPGVRSILGTFVAANNRMLEESLFGGTLSTSWALFNLERTKAKISLIGIKKIEGKETYAIEYLPKGGSDLTIRLYFNKSTFNHVRTEYKRTSSAGIGTRPEQSSGFSETRLTLTEDFSDHRIEKGLNLPHSYNIFYSISGQNGTTEIKWKFIFNEFALNQKLDENSFNAEAK
jgi:hypothetical protein